MDPAKTAALDHAADQFIERLHQTLDLGSLTEIFSPDFPALNREYPGEFAPFATPRMSLSLLKITDNETMRRKLLAEWNLYYWTSLLALSNPNQKDPLKALPPEFVKAARKSEYLKCFVGGGAITLASPEELTKFLAEAEQLGGILKRRLRADLPISEPFKSAVAELRKNYGPPRTVPVAMGFDKVYLAPRDTITLVMVERDNQFKLVALSPLN